MPRWCPRSPPPGCAPTGGRRGYRAPPPPHRRGSCRSPSRRRPRLAAGRSPYVRLWGRLRGLGLLRLAHVDHLQLRERLLDRLDLLFWTERQQRARSEEHTSELQSHSDLVCRLLLEKKKKNVFTDLSLKKKKKKRRTHT